LGRSILLYMRRHHLALLALFVALGGTSVAASNVLVPRNSVGSRQIINGAVHRIDINKTTLKSLRGAAGPRGAQGTQGPQGAQGSQGAQGKKGATGASGMSSYTTVQGTTANNSDQYKTVDATCPPGDRVVGGGAWVVPADAGAPVAVVRDQPASTYWIGAGSEVAAYAGNWYLVTSAVCVKVEP